MTPSNPLEWLASLSFEVAVVVLYVPALIIATMGTILVRWIFEEAIATYSAVAPAKTQYMAEVYSALLGFLIVMAYDQYGDTQTAVRQEVERLKLIKQVAAEFQPADRLAIHFAVSNYARTVVDDEWHLMAFGGESATVDAAITAMFEVVPRADGGESLNTALAANQVRDLIREVAAARVVRVTAAPDSEVANFLSGVVVLITAVAIAIPWFLRGPSLLVHLILGAFLVTTFLTLILLAVELVYPFAGDLRIAPNAFDQLLI